MSEGNYVSGGRPLNSDLYEERRRLHYGDLFEEWEMTIARNAVIRFKAKYPWLRFPDFDDLLQECLIQWYFTRGMFDPGRGASIKTYMSRVVGIRLLVILREQMACKCRANHLACSLNEYSGKLRETPVDIAADKSLADITLRADVQSVLEELTSFQQSICRLLSQGYSVRRTAEVLDKPRSTVRDQIKIIREVFTRRGFADY